MSPVPEAAPRPRVIAWTAPRCLSTAFERCVMEIPRGKVFHEPFSYPYYFGPERVSSRYAEDKPDETRTYASTLSELTKGQEGRDYVFIKDMAYYLHGRHRETVVQGLSDFRHTFLIRDPAKAILSLYKASLDKGLTGWEYFDEAEAGFLEMQELYEILTSAGHAPVVVDAADLLEGPEQMMRLYCDATGLDFVPGMTSWEAGEQPDWDVWDGWHDDALKSTGFRKTVPGKGSEPAAELPEEIQAVVARAMPAYKALHAQRLLLNRDKNHQCEWLEAIELVEHPRRD